MELEPRLAVHTLYWLSALLAVSGEIGEARNLAEEGLLLAWEQGASEEVEVFDDLWRQLDR